MTHKQVREKNGQFSYLTRWQYVKRQVKTFFKRVFYTIALINAGALIILGIYTAGMKSVITYAAGETVIQVDNDFPILDKIATCESKGKQFQADGTLTMHVNTNKTVDFGKYEINSIWEARAVKLGYDIFTEQGNHDMSLWLFRNYGSDPWNSSRSCWAK